MGRSGGGSPSDNSRINTASCSRRRSTPDGRTAEVTTGQAVTIPADSLRRIRTGTIPGEALVCMVPGGHASVPGKDGTMPLPWAE